MVIDAQGAWSPDTQNRICWCGADGIANLPAEEGFLMPGANVGALIAKIDDMVFAVGSRYDNAAPAEGVIFLAMNENPEHKQSSRIAARTNYHLRRLSNIYYHYIRRVL